VKVARFRSLAVRVYVFAIVCTLLVIVTHAVVMPSLGRASLHARFEHDQRALVDLVGLIDDPAAANAAVSRIAESRHADVALVGPDGRVIASAGAPMPPLGREALAALERVASFKGGGGVIALRVDGPGKLAGNYLVMRGAPPQFPAEATLVVILVMLAMVGLVSLGFARGLVRPLGHLAAAAERFGAGDLSTRAHVHRRDELGQVGEAFDQMAHRIAALLDANQSLLANVSHELRTPLARIRVALELAEASPAEAQEVLAGVGEDLGELEHLIEEIFMMTRLASPSAAPPLDLQRCAPQELADRVGRRWRQLHGGRRLDAEVAAEAPAIEGDPMLLRRVIDNLLDNAAKYSPAERPVLLRVLPAGDTVRFEVVDQGRGLSAEELTHAFTPFWRADSSRTRGTGGIGLGLALARQIARAHGGDVTLESEPGRGTRAILSVPRAA
jgi:two-component system OmpR family sensor kinase